MTRNMPKTAILGNESALVAFVQGGHLSRSTPIYAYGHCIRNEFSLSLGFMPIYHSLLEALTTSLGASRRHHRYLELGRFSLKVHSFPALRHYDIRDPGCVQWEIYDSIAAYVWAISSTVQITDRLYIRTSSFLAMDSFFPNHRSKTLRQHVCRPSTNSQRWQTSRSIRISQSRTRRILPSERNWDTSPTPRITRLVNGRPFGKTCGHLPGVSLQFGLYC